MGITSSIGSIRLRAHLYRQYSIKKSIALGYARSRQGVGGVRNHLNAIKAHSSKKITLIPDQWACAWAEKHNRWKDLEHILFNLPLEQFGVVHSHVSPDFIRACETAHAKGTPWVHTYHTLYFPEDWGGTLAPWQEEINQHLIECASKADVRISISRWLHDLLEKEYGITSLVIPNGVDTDKCLAVGAVSQPSAGGYVLFSGSLNPVKNPELFIDLAKVLPDMQFLMIGKDLLPKQVSKYYGKPIPKNLKLLGPVSHETALAYTKAAHAIVVTSHSEGLPTSVMEAMAMGRPVIVPNSFGCGDLVEHEKTGYVYQPGNLEQLREYVLQGIDSKEVGPNAIDMINREYAWSSVASRLDAVYADMMANYA